MRPPRGRAALAALAVVLAVAAGCLADARGWAFAQDNAKLKEMYRRPDTIPFPADNPYSDAKAKLGEMLFFDPRMSGDKNISCATCHTPSLAWSDPLKVSIGAGNQPMSKRSQTLLNLAWTELLMWDGRFPSLEDQVLGPLFKSDIMGNSKTGMVEEINAIPAYRGLFEQAFPGGAVSVEAVAKALATYERTIVSNKAPFDRWIENDENALDAAAKRGFALFNGKANCAACHNTWRFTDDGFHDIGLADQDPGRGKQVPDVPVLMHAFKTPTLRNVAQRPPYMHDGTIDGLEAVVRHYAQGFVTRPSLSPEMKKLDLTARDIQDLVAFMRSLTSDDDPVTIPVLPAKEAM
ncbi:MAG: c-type cytochrome [Proteobacteria bacterium]|nr:c-type cytochrome [Pseudomonadota bacterium]